MVDGAKAEAVKAGNPIVALVNTTAQALFSGRLDSGNHILS